MRFLSGNGISSVGADVGVILTLTVLTLAAIFAVIVCICKFADADAEAPKRTWVLLAALGAGFVIRLIFALTIRGNRSDYGMFTSAFSNLEQNGLKGYYSGDASSVLYPAVYFIYLIFGGLSNATGLSGYGLGMQFMIKLPLIIADLLAAFGIYKIASRYFNRNVGYILCAFVCVCPVFFTASVLWTSAIAFTSMFLVFAFYFLARKNYAAAIAFSTAAAFSSKEGIYIFPIMAVFCAYHLIRAIINIKNNRPHGKAIFDGEYRAVIFVPLGFVASLLSAYLIGLFMISSYSYNFFTYIYEFLISPFADWKYFSYNGLSIYTVFNQNGQSPGARFPAWIFFGVFLAIILAVVCIVYFTKRNRATLVMLASYALFTMQIFYPGADAVGAQAMLFAVLAAYILVGDKRLLYILFLTGICFVINAAIVLAVAGYLNNAADYYFTGEGYTGVTLLTGGLSAIPIACSVIAVISHLYFTYVTVSVGMSGQKKMLSAAHGLGGSMKEFFRLKKVD